VISPQSGDPSTNIHANAQTCPNCRALIVSRVLDDHVAVPKVAQEFRVTSQTVHKWLRRFKSEGAKGLNDRSSAPASIPRRQIQPGKALQDAVMEVLHVANAGSTPGACATRLLATLNSLSREQQLQGSSMDGWPAKPTSAGAEL
jgi:transposase-like protein